jgi:hypothetical protein
MTTRLAHVVVDANDHDPLARYWAEVPGFRPGSSAMRAAETRLWAGAWTTRPASFSPEGPIGVTVNIVCGVGT